jgi:hypothetical protein
MTRVLTPRAKTDAGLAGSGAGAGRPVDQSPVSAEGARGSGEDGEREAESLEQFSQGLHGRLQG